MQVYRYLEDEYVHRFLKEGILRLSSFSAFEQHPDEERRDSKEGWGVVTHHNSDGTGQQISAVVGRGQDAYVLCGATILSDELRKAFHQTGFHISDTTAFTRAVSRHIPDLKGINEGPCRYVKARIVERDMGHIDFESLRLAGDKKAFDMGKMASLLAAMAGDDFFFMKPLQYSHQCEYRMLWFVSGAREKSIEIKCPEAIQFCTAF